MPEQQEPLHPEAEPVAVEFRDAWASVIRSSDGRRVIASVYGKEMLQTLYLTPAEARALGEALIQQAGGDPMRDAAPALLEAARFGLRFFEQVHAATGYISDGERIAHEAARAAMAKATGGEA